MKLYCGIRNPFDNFRSAEVDTRDDNDLPRTRILVFAAGRGVESTGFLGGDKTIDFGFCRKAAFVLSFRTGVFGFCRANVLIFLCAVDFAFIVFDLPGFFALDFAILFLDSVQDILSAIYC